ncbi:MAG TPA: ABC transporter ATP-binding protein [Nitriliruptoraceae bacterium]|nr:ABC transporter ATP-binding protein [Nitriliruptoraceae bacterium]
MARASEPAPPRLDVDDVSVRYGDLVAVDGVDLEVAAGEVVALLGPSGCGKSSLLNAIAGLVPHGGAVRIDGTDVGGRRPDQRDLGLMFQSGALFPHMDVAGNVDFGLRMQGMEVDARRARAAEVLDLVGLAGLGGRRIDALSGGQAQRVALARAIAPQPRLLLLDEPLSSLDRRLRDRLLVELPDVFAAVDAAVVHVTHDQDEAMALADRVVVMDRGHIAAVDTPTGLWADPGSMFVAAFLGWPNILPLTDAATRALVPDRVIAAFPSHIGAVGVDAGRVHLHVVDAPASPADGPAPTPRSSHLDPGTADTPSVSAPGAVTSRRFAGDHARVTVALDDVDLDLTATGPVHLMPAPGDTVVATIRDVAWAGLVETT